MTDQEIIEQWRDQDAPLLPVLHAFHDRDGYLSDDALHAISNGLGIPLAELFGTVTFYHHFSREKGGRNAPRVCTGNVCCLHGGRAILDALKPEGATAMPCSGRCDDLVPIIRGDQVYVGPDALSLQHRATPIPDSNPAGSEECVFRAIREEGRATLDGYRNSAGYEGLQAATRSTPEALLETITKSKLAGRGGAGFPTGLKWKAVADAPGTPKTIVCNADEGEPGCFKDRALMDHDPFALLEGMTLVSLPNVSVQLTQSIIPLGAVHRLENPGKVDLDLIEVQSGSYLGEDDIVRFDDVYGRSDSEPGAEDKVPGAPASQSTSTPDITKE